MGVVQMEVGPRAQLNYSSAIVVLTNNFILSEKNYGKMQSICSSNIVTVYPAQEATPYQNDQILRKFLMWEGEVIIDPKVNIAFR